MDFADVTRARVFLRDQLAVTRLVRAASLGRDAGARVYLKLESEHPTGSFKVRGALTALARNRERGRAGVVTCSTGNHGAAVAYAARRLGLAATVYLPERPNPVKRARIVELGARVVEAGRDYDEAREHAARHAREHSAYLVEDGRDPDLTAGAATLGCEIVEQLPEVDVVYVPVGDTTLIRGVASAVRHLRPAARVVGVQAEGAPAYFRSWHAERVVSTETCDTVADGLAVRSPTAENVRELRTIVDTMRLVSDGALLGAVYRLLVEEHTVAEPAGAASTAAFLDDAAAQAGQAVVLVVTGANITPDLLRRAVLTGGGVGERAG